MNTEESLAVLDLIIKGGTATIVIIIFLLIILGTALFIYFERILTINEFKIDDEGDFTNQIRNFVSTGNLSDARNLCAESDSPVAKLLEKGISRIGKSTAEITEAIESAGQLEVYRLEKNVSLIGTFAGIAPMIGFLGTVIGMIIAFHEMASQGGQAKMELLATGIYTAMTTTVAGLIVGIICTLAYNHLTIKIEKLLHMVEENVISFMDTLNDSLSV